MKPINDAEAWNNGCATDVIRNEFLIPEIITWLCNERPQRILDIGTGTGYIPRLLDSKIPYSPDWTIIDIDANRIAVAERLKLPDMHQQCIVGPLNCLDSQRSTFDLVLLTFTLLEADDPMGMAEESARLLADNGMLVIALPDGWRDILAATIGEDDLSGKFLNEAVKLHKIDKFTGSLYPFITMRIESIISAVLRQSCALEALEQGGPLGEVYMLVFRKRGAAASAAPHA